jgi:hypothetical protein
MNRTTRDDQDFDRWIDELNKEIQSEYESKDMNPADWFDLYQQGLTPSQAWRRALKEYSEDHVKYKGH